MNQLSRPLRSYFKRVEWKKVSALDAELRILRLIERAPDAAHVIRIAEFLHLARKAEELRLQLYEHVADFDRLMEYSRRGYSFDNPEVQALNLEFLATLHSVEERLKRYQFRPRLLSPQLNSLGLHYTWPKEDEDAEQEHKSVSFLLGQAQDGSGRVPASILNFRHCQQCKRLFYAKADHARFCGAACRKKLHASSPKERSRNAAYMRRYRRDNKAREKRQEAAWRTARKSRKA